jgi:8-oxo-dGTP pyrophosphatase MutT (NUDIX family)
MFPVLKEVLCGGQVVESSSAEPSGEGPVVKALLAAYQPVGETEAADVARMAGLAAAEQDPWSRALPLHFTASAVVVHPASGRVLLRWHPKHGRWLQVGGHADPGESDPLYIALREAAEETGLHDLVPWPGEQLCHAVVCDVGPSPTEPEHEHADLRYVFATGEPGAIAPEGAGAPLRWLTVEEARVFTGGGNLVATLDRIEPLLAKR